jgi:hypothetical protein
VTATTNFEVTALRSTAGVDAYSRLIQWCYVSSSNRRAVSRLRQVVTTIKEYGRCPSFFRSDRGKPSVPSGVLPRNRRPCPGSTLASGTAMAIPKTLQLGDMTYVMRAAITAIEIDFPFPHNVSTFVPDLSLLTHSLSLNLRVVGTVSYRLPQQYDSAVNGGWSRRDVRATERTSSPCGRNTWIRSSLISRHAGSRGLWCEKLLVMVRI